MTTSSGKMQNNLALPYDFEISNLLNDGWTRVHGSKATYWKAIFTYAISLVVLSLVLGAIVGLFLYLIQGPTTSNEPRPVFQLMGNLISLFLFPMLVGIYYIGALRASDQAIQTKLIFNPFSHKFRLWGVLILSYLISGLILFVGFFLDGLIMALLQPAPMGFSLPWLFGGLIAFIVVIAAIYFLMAFLTFSPLLIFEKNMGIISAMKASLYAFSHRWFKISLLQCVLILITFISTIPLFIGLIWTAPFAFNVYGSLYYHIFGVEK